MPVSSPPPLTAESDIIEPQPSLWRNTLSESSTPEAIQSDLDTAITLLNKLVAGMDSMMTLDMAYDRVRWEVEVEDRDAVARIYQHCVASILQQAGGMSASDPRLTRILNKAFTL